MTVFSKEILSLTPIKYKDVTKSPHYLVGDAAVRKVEELEGPLTEEQKKVVRHEGFVGVPYLDSKGVPTIGVGMTGKYMKGTFKDAFSDRKALLVKKIPKLEGMPEYLRAELIQSSYRGGINQSTDTIKLINKGLYEEAAGEFLNNREYFNPFTEAGVENRMRDVSLALVKAGDIRSEVSDSIQSQLKDQEVSAEEPSSIEARIAELEEELGVTESSFKSKPKAKSTLTPEKVARIEELEAELEINKVYKGPASEEKAEVKTDFEIASELYL